MESLKDKIKELEIIRLKEEAIEYIKDSVVKEEEFNIYINDNFKRSILCTPTQINHLIIGLLNFYDIKRENIKKIRIDNKKIFVSTTRMIKITNMDEEIDCIGSSSLPKPNILIKPKIYISQAKLYELIKEFKRLCKTYKETGGIHAAALADEYKIHFFAEDISRHNAVDKVIGAAILNGATQVNVLLTTGRATLSLLHRANKYNLEMIIALSATTNAAVDFAKKCGISVIAFAKFSNRLNIYSHPERIKMKFYSEKTEDIFEKINYLKQKSDAVILAHNYQSEEIQKLADFVGDSLELAKYAASQAAKLIVVCGVRFMAETVKLLAPDKEVLLPAEEAGCPLADMINPDQIRELKEKYPNAIVVCYINSSVAVKAEVDICCTSRNALNVINSIPKDKDIIFVPDKYLGSYIQSKLNRRLILWEGFCPVHMKIVEEDILEKKSKYPGAPVISHPECKEEVWKLSDVVCGTGDMIRFAKDSDKEEFIVATEKNMCVRLKLELPQKRFYPASEDAICPNMQLITPKQLLFSLKERRYKINIEEELASAAKKSIEKMLKI